MNKIFIVIYAFNLTYKLTTIKKLSAMGEFFMVVDKTPLDLRFLNIFIFPILTKR